MTSLRITFYALAPLQKGNVMHSQPTTVLIVDDDPHLRESLREILEYANYSVEEAADGKIALEALAQRSIDLMLLDLDLPRVSGMEVLRQTAAAHPEIMVVIISGKGTIRTAVEATKLGAYDFLEKPLEAERTLLTVRNALEKASLQRQRDRLLDEARQRYKMVGSSLAMQDIYRLIDKAATTQSKVLIVGENGTGKEMIARAIHHNSARAAGPFVTVNCAAIPETLIESELFGHEKGAFTGAQSTHRGKFEQANGGTLFLDEIGDMSLMMQAKTLRVLAEGVIERLGGEKSIAVDVRIIAATNKNLEDEMAEGNFREDLFYRLNVIPIHVPPLRERREDIPDLVNNFLNFYCEENRLSPKKLERGALTVLLEHDWPGNVRQLRNVIERLVVLSDIETINPREVAEALEKFFSHPQTPSSYATLREARAQFEREHILKALIANDWKIQETAAALGIERTHLWKKMKRYGIEAGR
jgi:two-component system nitrogen regulation response regulator NtrX